MVQMKGFEERTPAQLSGGQQQRVALARALVNRPAVLLLDEPMSALDRKLREDTQIELKLLQQQLGTTFVFVTHDQEEAMSMSDRIAVMNGGRIEQIGVPSDVYDRPATEFVAGFIGQQNFFRGQVERADASGTTISVPGGLIASTATADGATPGGTAVLAVRPEKLSLSATAPDDAVSPPKPNLLACTLMSISQVGATLQIVLLTEEGLKVVARSGRELAIPATIGATVYATWAASDVHVYPATPSA